MKEKKLYFALAFILLVGIVVTAILVMRARQLDEAARSQTGNNPDVLSIAQEPEKIKADLTIKYSDTKVASFSGVALEPGKSVLDLLVTVASRDHLPISYKTSSSGAFIEGIDDVSGSMETNKWWLYYVNGKAAVVSVDQYTLSDGDKVEFRYEASPF